VIFQRIPAADCHSGDSLPRQAAVYAWQISPPTDPHAISDENSMFELVKRIAFSPVLSISHATLSSLPGRPRSVRQGFIKFDRIQFGGSVQDESILADLRRQVSSAKGRDRIASYLKAAEEFAPVLYVGQTKNIRRRVMSHLSMHSSLRKRVEACGLQVDDLVLRFIEMPASSKTERTIVERLLTHYCLAPLTVRAG
jgi:hypothetical protein